MDLLEQGYVYDEDVERAHLKEAVDRVGRCAIVDGKLGSDRLAFHTICRRISSLPVFTVTLSVIHLFGHLDKAKKPWLY